MATYGQSIVYTFGPAYPGAKIYHYAAGTTTLQNVWTDRNKTSAAAQPVVCDSNGYAQFFGDGIYKFRIDSAADVTLYTWDNVNLVDLPLRGKGANLTSAGTVTFGTDGDVFHITGSTGPITNFSGTQSAVTLIYDSTPTITNSANIILIGAANYTAAANDTQGLINEGGGVWREVFRSQSSTATLGANSFTGIQRDAKSANIASAATTDLSTATGNFVHITGSVGITAFGTVQAGTELDLVFDGAPLITYNSTSMITSTGANIQAAAGDTCTVRSEGSGNWRFMSYRPAILEAQLLENVGFTATVAANALTITLTDAVGGTLSANNRARVGFRSATLTSGAPVVRTITAPLTLVVSAGSTLGTTSAVASTIWWGLIDNAGTPELVVWNPLASTFSEGGLVSTTAEGGAGAADSANTLYSTTARSNVAFRHGGFITSTQATAGTWASAPTVLQNFGPGITLSLGDVVTVKVGTFTYDVSTASGTTTQTGIGFKPRIVLFSGGVPAVTGYIFWGGMDDGTTAACITSRDATANFQHVLKTTRSLFMQGADGTSAEALISAFSQDGWTLTWTKTGAPAGIAAISYTAIK